MDTKNSGDGVWVVIPASGMGSRMQSDIPKQYLSVQGMTILEHTISRFIDHSEVAGILVVVSSQDDRWVELEKSLYYKYQSSEVSLFSTTGGDERSETVLKGLSFLSETLNIKASQWVMVHDAARPCVHGGDIDKLLAICSDSDKDGGILATPVKDTLKRSDSSHFVLATQSREAMWQAQTPQLFRLGDLVESLKKAMQAGVSVTDEASAMEFNNKQVQLVEGSSDNVKLTTPSDLRLIDFLLKDT